MSNNVIVKDATIIVTFEYISYTKNSKLLDTLFTQDYITNRLIQPISRNATYIRIDIEAPKQSIPQMVRLHKDVADLVVEDTDAPATFEQIEDELITVPDNIFMNKSDFLVYKV